MNFRCEIYKILSVNYGSKNIVILQYRYSPVISPWKHPNDTKVSFALGWFRSSIGWFSRQQELTNISSHLPRKYNLSISSCRRRTLDAPVSFVGDLLAYPNVVRSELFWKWDQYAEIESQLPARNATVIYMSFNSIVIITVTSTLLFYYPQIATRNL